MPSTAHRALPYPAELVVPDAPLWVEALAGALDFDAFVITDNPRPAFGIAGRFHLLAGVLSFDTGAAWVTLPTGGPFLPTAGGALTGALDLGGQELAGAVVVEDRQKVTTVAAAGAARTLDAAVSPLFDVTLDQNVTFTFAGVDGDRIGLVLRQPGALKTVAWPATVDWPDAVVPPQVAATAVRYEFVRVAGRWVGVVFHDIPVIGRSLAKVKNADESITLSNTLQPDNELFLPLEANLDYAFFVVLRYSSGSTQGLSVALTVPAGAVLRWRALYQQSNNGNVQFGPNSWVTASGTPHQLSTAADTGDRFCIIEGSVRTGVNPGNLALQWAPQANNAAAVVVNAGSTLATIKES